MHRRWFDPYNQNTLKGDRPLKGTTDWFFTLNGDLRHGGRAALASRLPVGVQTTQRPGQPRHLRPRRQPRRCRRPSSSAPSLIKGSTAFKPPEIEFASDARPSTPTMPRSPERRILSIEPEQADRTAPTTSSACRKPSSTITSATSSDRYDFDSIRVGIQPFSSRFPRLPVPGQPARRPPVRQPRQQSLPVQSGGLPRGSRRTPIPA